MQVKLQISRTDGPATSCTGEIFALLELLRSNGDLLRELATGAHAWRASKYQTTVRSHGIRHLRADVWTLRTDWVWGAFWTLSLPPATSVVRS